MVLPASVEFARPPVSSRRRFFFADIISIAASSASGAIMTSVKILTISIAAAASNFWFSATMPPELNALTEKFMRNPVKILVKTDLLTLEGIAQYKIVIDDDPQKYATLKDIYSIISMSQCIIYCNSVKRVTSLYDAMKQDEFPVCCIHSSMEKEDRASAYDDFKTGKHRVLISSNVTARGIDIQQVSTVINFDIPKDVNTYLHRIGRSGRWGRKGIGINFVTRRDIRKIKDIEEHYNTQIPDLPANFGTDV